jgi:dolichol-phosphate mannosyltransferase
MNGLFECSDDFIILIDADLGHHPKAIPEFIKKHNQNIVTITHYTENRGVYGWDLNLKSITLIANFLGANPLTPAVCDLTASFHFCKKKVFEKFLKLVKSSGCMLQMEIILLTQNMDYRIGIYHFR